MISGLVPHASLQMWHARIGDRGTSLPPDRKAVIMETHP